MAELYRYVRTDLNAHSVDDVYEKVGYTEDDVRRLAREVARENGGNYWRGAGDDLLVPFRSLLDGGKPNG